MKSSSINIIPAYRGLTTLLKTKICHALITVLIGAVPACVSHTPVAPVNSVQLPSDKQLTIRNSPTLALSPDGKLIVYPADSGDTDSRQLYVQPINGQGGRLLPDTKGGEMPFFSPDGQWLGFFADGHLKKVSIKGGDPQILSEVGTPAGGAWGSDNSIVFADGPVWGIPATGGTPRQLSQLQPGQQHSWPSLLPNGKLIFNLMQQGGNAATVVLKQPGSDKLITLVEEGNYPFYTDNGYLTFNQGGSLMAVPLDINLNRITGTPVMISDGVLLSASTGAAQYSISQSGGLVFVPGKIFGQSRRIVLIDREGNERDAGLPLRRYGYVRFSADGQLLAIETNGQILIQGLQDRSLLGVFDNATYPVWGPDEEHITFSSVRQGVAGLYRALAIDGTAVENVVTGEYPLDHSYAWSLDGNQLAYTEIRPETGMDIWIHKANASTEPFLNTDAHECCPVFSPDGLWVAYISDQSGRPELYLTSVSNRESTYQVSDKGAREPVWSHSGNELFYWQDRQLMTVKFSTRPALKIGTPSLLFQGIFVSSTSTWRTRYDISPADDEFVIIRRGIEELGVRELKYNANWTSNIKR